MASNGSSKNVHKVVILQGDGIGPEVTGEAVKVLQAIQASPSSSVEFDLQYHDFGGIAIDNHGDPLPASTLDACRKSDAIILGAWPCLVRLEARCRAGLQALDWADFPHASCLPLSAHLHARTRVARLLDMI